MPVAVPVSLLLRPVVLVQRHLMGLSVIHVSGNADNAGIHSDGTYYSQELMITLPKRGQGLTALTGI